MDDDDDVTRYEEYGDLNTPTPKVSLTLELALDDELDVDLTPDAVLVAGSTAHRSSFFLIFILARARCTLCCDDRQDVLVTIEQSGAPSPGFTRGSSISVL